jgi:hypothetical protein
MDLITLTEYKTYQGITNPNEDTLLSSIIAKCSDLVKTYCRRTFVDYTDDNKVEVFNGGFEDFRVSELPLIQVLSVENSTDYGQTWTDLTEFEDWVWDQEGERLVTLDPSGTWKHYLNGYKITYFGGYEVLPGDLKLAVMDLVTYYRRNDGAIHSTKSPGSNSVQIEYISTTNLPAHIKRVLDLYSLNYN